MPEMNVRVEQCRKKSPCYCGIHILAGVGEYNEPTKSVLLSMKKKNDQNK